jgi:hypothetical protein
MKKHSLLVIAVLICSCTMPATTVRTIDNRPTIAIIGASKEAILYVDGISMGKANLYDSQPRDDSQTPNVLKVEPGTHRVKVTDQNITIYDKDVFVESELKTITVR